MTLTPLRGMALIEPDAAPAEKTTVAGIILPGAKKEAPSTGIIRALGTDCPEDLEVGQRVLFGRYDFDIITLNDGELSLGPADKVLGIFT